MIVFGDHDTKTLAQFRDVSSRAVDSALMADGHLGYVMPIGGVAAYDNRVSVVGVGFDIACGNAAIRTDLDVAVIGDRYDAIADEIFGVLSFGVGLNNESDDAPTGDPLFEDDAWDVVPSSHRERLRSKARAQLGTIGSGNHYVDVFEDESGIVWVGVHFGSRGFGHTVASSFLSLSQGGRWGGRGREIEVLLDLDTPLGHDYFALMNLAGRYAYAGREWVVRKVVEILGAREQALVHNHHNFAWREEHGGRDLIVVRKGATPAWPGQKGFVGGSMGDDAVIVRGREDAGPEQSASLFSTVHGAGRVMSRSAAKGKWRKGRQISAARVSSEKMREWVASRGVVLRGGGLDEAPQVYRRLPEVLAAQGETIEVLHKLSPRIVCMAPGRQIPRPA